MSVVGWSVPRDVTGCVMKQLDWLSFVRFARTSKANLGLLDDQLLWAFFYQLIFKRESFIEDGNIRTQFQETYERIFLPHILARRKRKHKEKVLRIIQSFYYPFKVLLCNRILEGLSLFCFSLFFILLPFVVTSSITLQLRHLSLFLVACSVHLLLIFTISTFAALIFKWNGYENDISPKLLVVLSPRGLLHFPSYPLYLWRCSHNEFPILKLLKGVIIGLLLTVFCAFSVSLFTFFHSGYPSSNSLMILLLLLITSLACLFLPITLQRIDTLYMIISVVFLSMFIADCFHYFAPIPPTNSTTTLQSNQLTSTFSFLIYPYIPFSLITLYGLHSTLPQCRPCCNLLNKTHSFTLKLLITMIGACGIGGYTIFIKKFEQNGWQGFFSYEVYWFVWVIWVLVYVGWYWIFIRMNFKFGGVVYEYRSLLDEDEYSE